MVRGAGAITPCKDFTNNNYYYYSYYCYYCYHNFIPVSSNGASAMRY